MPRGLGIASMCLPKVHHHLQTGRLLELKPPCRHELPTNTAPANCSAGYKLSMPAMLVEARQSAATVAAGILVDFVV